MPENVTFITSSQNQYAKLLRSLNAKSSRDEMQCFFIEGYRAVCEYFKYEKERCTGPLQAVAVSESFCWTDEFNAIYKSIIKFCRPEKIFYFSDLVYKSISGTESPQGIGAVFSFGSRKISFSDFKRTFGERTDKIVLLDNVRDPGNMGTIIRTADAAGFGGVICLKGCVDVYNQKVLRSTAGSLFHIPVLQSGTNYPQNCNNRKITRWLKENEFKICAAHPRGGKSCFEADFSGKTAILVGNEANGLDKGMLEECDITVTIPMPGKAESLNASVAAAIMIYETIRN